MTILEYYKNMCSNDEVNEIYYSTGNTQKEGRGKIFSFFNTNYRTLLTKQSMEYKGFGVGFNTINSVAGIPYSKWPQYEKNYENIFKQHTVRMRKSELFQVEKGIYQKTKRGLVFERMLNADESILGNIDKRLICLILILTGYFSNVPNYIIERTKFIFNCYNTSGYTDNEILLLQKNYIIDSKEKTKQELFKMDYPYLDSFCSQYKEIDFNKLYKYQVKMKKMS